MSRDEFNSKIALNHRCAMSLALYPSSPLHPPESAAWWLTRLLMRRASLPSAQVDGYPDLGLGTDATGDYCCWSMDDPQHVDAAFGQIHLAAMQMKGLA